MPPAAASYPMIPMNADLDAHARRIQRRIGHVDHEQPTSLDTIKAVLYADRAELVAWMRREAAVIDAVPMGWRSRQRRRSVLAEAATIIEDELLSEGMDP